MFAQLLRQVLDVTAVALQAEFSALRNLPELCFVIYTVTSQQPHHSSCPT